MRYIKKRLVRVWSAWTEAPCYLIRPRSSPSQKRAWVGLLPKESFRHSPPSQKQAWVGLFLLPFPAFAVAGLGWTCF